MKKKLLVLMMCLCASLAVTACGENSKENTKTESASKDKKDKEDKKDKKDKKDDKDKKKDKKDNKKEEVTEENNDDYDTDEYAAPGVTYEEAFGMSKDEWLEEQNDMIEEQEKSREESLELWEYYEIKNDEETYEFDLELNGVNIAYEGDGLVQVILGEELLLVRNHDGEGINVSVYGPDDLGQSAYNKIVRNGTKEEDRNGNELYIFDSPNQDAIFYAFEESGTIVIITYKGRDVVDNTEVYID